MKRSSRSGMDGLLPRVPGNPAIRRLRRAYDAQRIDETQLMLAGRVDYRRLYPNPAVAGLQDDAATPARLAGRFGVRMHHHLADVYRVGAETVMPEGQLRRSQEQFPHEHTHRAVALVYGLVTDGHSVGSPWCTGGRDALWDDFVLLGVEIHRLRLEGLPGAFWELYGVAVAD